VSVNGKATYKTTGKSNSITRLSNRQSPFAYITVHWSWYNQSINRSFIRQKVVSHKTDWNNVVQLIEMTNLLGQVIQGSQGALTVALIIKQTKALHTKMGI